MALLCHIFVGSGGRYPTQNILRLRLRIILASEYLSAADQKKNPSPKLQKLSVYKQRLCLNQILDKAQNLLLLALLKIHNTRPASTEYVVWLILQVHYYVALNVRSNHLLNQNKKCAILSLTKYMYSTYWQSHSVALAKDGSAGRI